MELSTLIKAIRMKMRFKSNRGHVSIEDLFDMPLTSKDGFDLDTVAKTVFTELKKEGESSFVETKTSARKANLELQLEVVKMVIKTIQDENAAKRDRSVKASQRAELQAALQAAKQNQLASLSVEELEKQLATLPEDI